MSADNKKKLYSEEPINIEDIENSEDLNLYKQKQKISFTCPTCHEITVKYQINYQKNPQCSKCIRKQSFESVDWKGDVRQKAMETKTERYGNPNYTNTEKRQKTLENKSPEETKEIYDKVKQTNQERYGGHPAVRPEQKERTRRTCQERYGCNAPSQNSVVRQKYMDTCKERYGFENSFQVPRFIEKAKQTKSEAIQKPSDEPNGSGEYLYHNRYFNSTDELKQHILTENNEPLITEHIDEYVKLFKTDLEFPFLNQDFKLRNDDGIIQKFHKSIYYANRNGFRSPFSAWSDKNLIEKAALNRLKYTGKCRPSDIFYGFNVAKIAPKVSVFSPALATRLIRDYLNKYHTVFDPFSGFSGRLLGTFNNDKVYIGSDKSEIHVSETNEIIGYKQAEESAKVYVDDVLITEHVSYECLFTCPPYNDKEQWNEDDVNLSCDEWIDICLEKFDCEVYLFVVDHTEKYKDRIVETIENKSHFSVSSEYVVFIQQNKKLLK